MGPQYLPINLVNLVFEAVQPGEDVLQHRDDRQVPVGGEGGMVAHDATRCRAASQASISCSYQPTEFCPSRTRRGNRPLLSQRQRVTAHTPTRSTTAGCLRIRVGGDVVACVTLSSVARHSRRGESRLRAAGGPT